MYLKQSKNKFQNKIIYNCTFYPCPILKDYVFNIKEVLKKRTRIFNFNSSISRIILLVINILLKFFGHFSIFDIFKRFKKLHISNYIVPNFLIENKYRFLFNLNSAMKNWKKNYQEDWK